MKENSTVYRELLPQDIEVVRPLWEKQREYHAAISELFRPTFFSFTFDQRMRGLLVEGKRLQIILAETEDTQEAVGYCISALVAKQGEIASLFVDKQFRRRGIGGEFMNRALEWLKQNSAETIRIEVLANNDPALAFYSQFGFVPRTCVLQQPPR